MKIITRTARSSIVIPQLQPLDFSPHRLVGDPPPLPRHRQFCCSDDERADHLVGFNRPATPSSSSSSVENEPQSLDSRPRGLADEEDDDDAAAAAEGALSRSKPSGAAAPKSAGYVSRIEQILYEDPESPIMITDAGKSPESGGSFIAYTIRTGVSCPVPIFTSIVGTEN